MIEVNGKGIILPKQREIILSKATKPRFHGLPKFQRGFFRAPGMWHDAGGITPSATNITVTHTVSSGVANAGVIFNYNDDGNAHRLFMRQLGVVTTLGNDSASANHDSEWTGGETITGTEWEVACTSEDSGTWDLAHASVGVYTDFSTAGSLTVFRWSERRSGGKGYTPGTNTCTATFRIREVADTSNFDDFQVIATATQT